MLPFHPVQGFKTEDISDIKKHFKKPKHYRHMKAYRQEEGPIRFSEETPNQTKSPHLLLENNNRGRQPNLPEERIPKFSHHN